MFWKRTSGFLIKKEKTNNISKLYEALKSVKRKKKHHIIHMQPIYILDWSTGRSGRELCWTRGENIQFFRDFDKENYVLYDFVDSEYIGYYIILC